MNLPPPAFNGSVSVEQAILSRRTTRAFSETPISIQQLSQILWAGQGITDERRKFRAVASGGALYPLDLYAAIGDSCVTSLDSGLYHYTPLSHALKKIASGDLRTKIAEASLRQSWMAKAPVNIVITSEYPRICSKYGKRGIRYAMMESGHSAQNIFLQAESMGLGVGIVGAFQDETLQQVLAVPITHAPLLVLPVGFKKDSNPTR